MVCHHNDDFRSKQTAFHADYIGLIAVGLESLKMGVFMAKISIIFLAIISLAVSVNITVLDKGNVTSSLQYGIMFEMRILPIASKKY